MKATGLTRVVPRRFIVPLNQRGCPKIESKCFKSRFVKRRYTMLGKAFSANLFSLNSKNFTDKVPNHAECSSAPLKYTVARYTSMFKELWICSCIYHFCRFSSLSVISIRRSVFKEFLSAFTIPFTFPEIMKYLY